MRTFFTACIGAAILNAVIATELEQTATTLQYDKLLSDSNTLQLQSTKELEYEPVRTEAIV